MGNFIDKPGTSRLGTSARLVVAGSTVAAVVSSAFSAQCRQIRVTFATTIAGDFALFSIDDGTPTVGSSSAYIVANWTDYFTVTPGQKIAVTGGSTASTGSLNVIECS